MSLNWNFTDKERFAKLTEEEKKQNDLYVWGCLAVGIGEITKKNAKEWLARYAFYTNCLGAMYLTKGEPYIPSLEDVEKRIGLRTNVFPNETEAAFAKKVYQAWKRDNVRREVKKAVIANCAEEVAKELKETNHV